MKTPTFKPHPYSNTFPMMRPDEFDDLVESIEKNGLREAIVLYRGMILDGRNRYKACLETGQKIRCIRFDGTDDEARNYVEDVNLQRRHLSSAQKACYAAERNHRTKLTTDEIVAKARSARMSGVKGVSHGPLNHRNKNVWACAKKFAVGSGSVGRAITLHNNCKELFEKVKSGELGLQEAYRQYRKRSGSAPQNNTEARQITLLNLEASRKIKIPDADCTEPEVDQFIKWMIKAGWRMEMKTPPIIKKTAEIVNGYQVNWHGNGFPSLYTCWADCPYQETYSRAVIEAAKEKLLPLGKEEALAECN